MFMYDSQPIITFSKHKGDDIGAFAKDWRSTVALNVVMRIMGSIGQDNKILNSNGEIEFLRNMFYNDGVIRGYLNRTIPNLICKDM